MHVDRAVNGAAFVLGSLIGSAVGSGIHVWIYNDGAPRWAAALVGAVAGFGAGSGSYTLLAGVL